MTVTHDTYSTAVSVCALLEQVAALGLRVPITLGLCFANFPMAWLYPACNRSLNLLRPACLSYPDPFLLLRMATTPILPVNLAYQQARCHVL